MKKEYLILGGTGPIGNGIINLLSKQEDVMIYVTTRQSISSSNERVVYVTGDAHNRSFLYPLIESKKWDGIIDCMIYPYFEFEAKIDKFLANTKQYIYMSSATVFADSKEPITENSPKLVDVCTDETFVFNDVYAITKARQEKLLFNSKSKNWTIVRPYITYGDYRLQLGCTEKEYWLYGAMHHRPIVFARDVAERYVTMTYCEDVGRVIVALLNQPKALGTDFNAVSNYDAKWGEILNIYLDALEKNTGYRPEVYWTDKYETYQGGGRYEDYKYDRLYDRVFDNSKLAEIIDVSNFVTPQVGLANCISHFVNRPQFKSIDMQSEIKKAQVTKRWPDMSEIKGLRKKLYLELIKFKIIPLSL